jgi:Zn-dependent protease
MFRSLRLGKAFGIPLFVHPTFFLLPLWVLYTQRNEGAVGQLTSLAFLGAVFGCVVLHEFGHALMARYFGIGTRDVTLYPIGGVARLRSTGESPTEEVCIALAGPAVNLVLFLLLSPVALFAIGLGAFAGAPGGPLFRSSPSSTAG